MEPESHVQALPAIHLLISVDDKAPFVDHLLSPSAEAWCLKEPITHQGLWAPLSALSGSCTDLCEVISHLTDIYKASGYDVGVWH